MRSPYAQEGFGPSFGDTDGGSMELQQASAGRRWEVPTLRNKRDGKGMLGQHTKILRQFLRMEPDGTPPAMPLGSHMATIARAENHELALPQANPTPHRRGLITHRK